MDAMIARPPSVTTRRASRSTSRRCRPARETASGRAGIAGPPARRVSCRYQWTHGTYWTLFSSSLAIDAGIGK